MAGATPHINMYLLIYLWMLGSVVHVCTVSWLTRSSFLVVYGCVSCASGNLVSDISAHVLRSGEGACVMLVQKEEIFKNKLFIDCSLLR